ncbi:MAG: hypothetical protein WCH39_27115 [Schlesneria sp.]
MIPAQKVYRMLGKESLWYVAERCQALLSAEKIPYSNCGGVAVCLHGYQRNTVDLDLVIRSVDTDGVRKTLGDGGTVWDRAQARFRSPAGIAVQFRIAGNTAGKGSEVFIPDPMGDLNVQQREGIIVVRLSRLIEMKIACRTSNLRRTHKDFADVVELIAARNLDRSIARFLHPSLRATFRELVHAANANNHD